MFTSNDLNELEKRGISKEIAEQQIDLIKQGNQPVEAIRAAHVNDGIQRLSPHQKKIYIELWKEEKKNWNYEKFVPASGAASRMFKDLFRFLQDEESSPAVQQFFKQLNTFPFYNNLKPLLASKNLLNPRTKEDKKRLISFLLTQDGLNWSNMPKGLLPFHNRNGRDITALGEQMMEGCHYAADDRDRVRLHLTVNPDYLQDFHKVVQEEASSMEEFNFEISYSFQDHSTDTLALDDQNEAFRQKDGSLLFRPGGHGSLLQNLNNRPMDLFFIKNIDNVQCQESQHDTLNYFQYLAGFLLQARKELKIFQKKLDERDYRLNLEDLNLVKTYCGVDFTREERPTINIIKDLINRPMRVCGMVQNQGEPGGGPFWINDNRGLQSLQILESAQMDLEDPQTRDIFQSSSHFNPVFMVCCSSDLEGNTLDLIDFIDKKGYFLSAKSLEGRNLTALEHPGLWNGAMAYWNSIFVEIPIACFTPVKTINDLLRKQHR